QLRRPGPGAAARGQPRAGRGDRAPRHRHGAADRLRRRRRAARERDGQRRRLNQSSTGTCSGPGARSPGRCLSVRPRPRSAAPAATARPTAPACRFAHTAPRPSSRSLDRVIEVKGLVKRYGRFTAVDGLSFEVARGRVLALLGPNGAGKSTTIRAVTGQVMPSAGTVVVGGFDVAKRPLQAKALLGYVPDRPYLYPNLTGRELLR